MVYLLPSFIFILAGGPFIETNHNKVGFTAPLAAAAWALSSIWRDCPAQDEVGRQRASDPLAPNRTGDHQVVGLSRVARVSGLLSSSSWSRSAQPRSLPGLSNPAGSRLFHRHDVGTNHALFAVLNLQHVGLLILTSLSRNICMMALRRSGVV